MTLQLLTLLLTLLLLLLACCTTCSKRAPHRLTRNPKPYPDGVIKGARKNPAADAVQRH